MFTDITRKEKIRFLYNSNMIEQITLPQERYQAWDHSEYPEVSGHAFAMDYMLENCKTNLSEYAIQVMHGLLTKGLVDNKYRGHYRDCAVYIGGHAAVPPVAIKPMMEALMEQASKAKSEQDCWNVHHEFEVIHPFIDGNGRTGRLILNWMLLKNKKKFKTVYFDERYAYYDSIEAYRRDKGQNIY